MIRGQHFDVSYEHGVHRRAGTFTLLGSVDRRAVDKEHNFEDITSELEDRSAISQHEHNQQILHVLPKNVLHTSEAVRMASLRGHIEGDFTINNVAFLPITVVCG